MSASAKAHIARALLADFHIVVSKLNARNELYQCNQLNEATRPCTTSSRIISCLEEKNSKIL